MQNRANIFSFEEELKDARVITRGNVRFTVVDPKTTFWDKFEAGTWEPDLLDVLRANVNPATVFIDIGAWIGPTTLFALALGAEVIAVEPDPVALYFLKNNIAANPDFAQRLRLLPKAVAAKTGGAWLHAPRKGGDSMGTLVRLPQAAERYDVETITPAMLSGMVTDAARYMVKIDVEGGEYALSRSLDSFISERLVGFVLSFHPQIMLENRAMSPAAIQQETNRMLEPFLGYRRIGLDEGDRAPMPLEQRLVSRNSTLLFLR